jgi:hypothetical protein
VRKDKGQAARGNVQGIRVMNQVEGISKIECSLPNCWYASAQYLCGIPTTAFQYENKQNRALFL